MTLFRHYQPNTRVDHFELDGLLSRLDREIAQMGEDGEADTPYYVGARIAASIWRHHERVETQDDFINIFRKYLKDLEG